MNDKSTQLEAHDDPHSQVRYMQSHAAAILLAGVEKERLAAVRHLIAPVVHYSTSAGLVRQAEIRHVMRVLLDLIDERLRYLDDEVIEKQADIAVALKNWHYARKESK